ncbi:helix-turn-helix transcriptional regulator [Pseudonocardia parietis]|uniref:ArsR family transcriptional regulator n=1 Tax=Pseudonocardia parietis TaxID=570936 RepID=A0ABS4W0X0_9PSEU|nr:helix-turn-helix domain-containing protein [Pseudonocardia parietis]MBP2369593.1 putative ArsR family transcriptional regulator [Pseudonocardia parietis]
MDIGDDVDRDSVAGLSSLGDPVRRRLYDCVAARDEAITRDDAAAATGIGRSLAAYHLDKLAEAGLLTVDYARPPGRGGPGAGRPAKRYTRTQQEMAVTIPPRNYALLATLVTTAVAADTTGTVRAAVDAAARAAGQAAGTTDLMDALRAHGYEPATDPDGGIELRNCPFHRLAREHTELVCGLNLELIAGLLEAAGQAPQRAALHPRPGRCCVLVHGSDRHDHTT